MKKRSLSKIKILKLTKKMMMKRMKQAILNKITLGRTLRSAENEF